MLEAEAAEAAALAALAALAAPAPQDAPSATMVAVMSHVCLVRLDVVVGVGNRTNPGAFKKSFSPGAACEDS